MKYQRIKKHKKKSEWIKGFVKPADKLWKKCFKKKKKQVSSHQEITDANWWEWCQYFYKQTFKLSSNLTSYFNFTIYVTYPDNEPFKEIKLVYL